MLARCRWQCSNQGCLQEYGRHSNSIDVSKKVCGACRAPLTFLGRFRADGSPAKRRAPSKYCEFVKENMAQGERSAGARRRATAVQGPGRQAVRAAQAAWRCVYGRAVVCTRRRALHPPDSPAAAVWPDARHV